MELEDKIYTSWQRSVQNDKDVVIVMFYKE